MLRLLLLLTVFPLALIRPGMALADTPPVPQRKTEVIGSIEEKLRREEKQKKALAEQIKTLENQLGGTRSRLVEVARSVQKNEKTLQNLEGRIETLEKEQTVIRDSLKEDRSQIAHLVLALQRIKRVPPEALLARPGAPYKTAQSAMLMGDIIPALHKHAEALKENLQNLDKISSALIEDRKKALETADSLKAEHTKLSRLVGKREALYAQTSKDFKKREQEVRKISLQAQNLQDLVERLEEDKKRKAARHATRTAIMKAPGVPLPKTGQPQIPVSGIIRTRYDEPDGFGAPSKGITIESRPGAIVVAPMGGIVRFTGPFKRYGKMIILEHENGYHSLIAGLEKIDTVVGHSVSAGEPLGLLQYSDQPRPALYYELRFNGRPVNPSRKFADLS